MAGANDVYEKMKAIQESDLIRTIAPQAFALSEDTSPRKSFSVKMPARLHARLKAAATSHGVSMNALIVMAVESYLKTL